MALIKTLTGSEYGIDFQDAYWRVEQAFIDRSFDGSAFFARVTIVAYPDDVDPNTSSPVQIIKLNFEHTLEDINTNLIQYCYIKIKELEEFKDAVDA